MRSWESTSRRVAAFERVLGAGPWQRERLLGLGVTPRQLERDVAAGRLIRLRPGLYAAPLPAMAPVPRRADTDAGPRRADTDAGPPRADADAGDRADADADPAGQTGGPGGPGARAAGELLARFGAHAALSHETAGLLRGVWLPFPVDDRVHVTQPGAKVRGDALVRVHGSALEPHDVGLVGGARTTSLPRTAVDLARGRTFQQALVPLDAALRRLVVGSLPAFEARIVLDDPGSAAAVGAARDELLAAVERAAGRRGIAVVRDCLGHLDPRSESPYESSSRGLLIRAGLAPSAVGLAVRGASGATYVADLGWEEHGVLGEVDGLTKYGDDPVAVRKALGAERRRQRDLEDAGWVVVRWTAGEPAGRIVARVRRALGR